MRKMVVAAAFGTVLSGIACTEAPHGRPADTGLVRNGDFELGTGALAEGWSVEHGDVSFITRKQGDAGFQMVFNGDDRDSVLIASEHIAVSAGATYTFSLDYYQPTGDGFIGGARFEVRWLDQAKALAGRSIIEGSAVGRWTVLQHTVRAPDRAAYAELVVGRAPHPSVVSVDNVALYERR